MKPESRLTMVWAAASRALLGAGFVLLAARAVAGPPIIHEGHGEGFDNEARLVVGITVSGDVLISAGLEFLANDAWSLRGEVLWGIAEVPAFGLQGGLTRRWRLDGSDSADRAGTARLGLLSAGHLYLFARESPGVWRHLHLWHLSPGLRWGLGEAGSLDAELPIGWFHAQRKLLPIGLQSRWRNDEPLIE